MNCDLYQNTADDDPLRLSLPEVGFLFLLRSHREACSLLERHVCDAMAGAFPQDWRERIGDCFSGATRQWVMEDLKNTGRITDFFVLCKTIRSYIRRVFFVETSCAHASTGLDKLRLPDFHQTEYMSSTVQSLESVRHSVFHGEDVSTEEIVSALAYTAKILPAIFPSTLSSQSVDSLSSFEKQFKEMNMGMRTTVWTDALEGANVLLFRCFRKFEEELGGMLKAALPGEYMKCCGESSRPTHLGVVELFNILKKCNGRKEIWSLRKRGVKVNLVQVCNKLKSLRNQLAHGAQTSLSFIRQSLKDTEHFWKAFQMDHTALDQVTAHLAKFDAEKHRHVFDKISSVLTVVQYAISPSDVHPPERRPMRQMDSVFVGRQKELAECLGFLESSHGGRPSPENNRRLLIIEGVSGVGKSALARRLLHETKAKHRRQMWLCASTKSILFKELETHLFPSDAEQIAGLCGVLPFQQYQYILKRLSPLLIVFDDVHSDLMKLISSLLKGTQHDVIITSCHLPKPSLEALLAHFHSRVSVHLSCLSTESSLQIVHARGVDIDQDSHELIKTIINEKLGNLPLLVNLFSSLLRKEFTNRHRGPRQKSVREWLDSVSVGLDKQLLAEDGHGVDRFHVRGLTGLVSLALDHLQNDPATFSLMLIAAAISPAGTPWQFLQLDWKPSATYLHEFEQSFTAKANATCIHRSIECLFGKHGETRLKARERLQELGLIWWDDVEQVIHMHSLLQWFILNQVAGCGLFTDKMPWPNCPAVPFASLAAVLLAEEIMESFPELYVYPQIKKVGLKAKFRRRYPLKPWGVTVVLSLVSLHTIYAGADTALPEKLIWKLLLPSSLLYLSAFASDGIPTAVMSMNEGWRQLRILKDGIKSLCKDMGLLGSWAFQSLLRQSRLVHFGRSGGNLALQKASVFVHNALMEATTPQTLPKFIANSLPPPCSVFSFIGMPALLQIYRSALPDATFCDKLVSERLDHLHREWQSQEEPHDHAGERTSARDLKTAEVALVTILQEVLEIDSTKVSSIDDVAAECQEYALTSDKAFWEELTSPSAFSDSTVSTVKTHLYWAVVRSHFGCYQIAQEHCSVLLSLCDGALRKPQSNACKRITYCLLAFCHFHQGDLQNSLECLRTFLSLLLSELRATPLRQSPNHPASGFLFHHLTAYSNVAQFAIFISVLLQETDFVSDICSWDLDMNDESVAPSSPCPQNSVATGLCCAFSVQEEFFTRVEGYRELPSYTDLCRLATCYKQGQRSLREAHFQLSKEVFTDWVNTWQSLCDKYPGYKDKAQLEGSALTVLAGHVFQALGIVHEIEGNFKEAQSFLLKHLEFRKEELGRAHTSRIISCLHLCCVSHHLGDTSTAEKGLRQALTLLRDILWFPRLHST